MNKETNIYFTNFYHWVCV